MKRNLLAVTTLGLGVGMMYFADPARGARRRARLRDAAAHLSRVARHAAATTMHDVQHRLTGVAARTVTHFTERPQASDAVVAARVRTRLGRLVSHPHAIGVAVKGGTATLSGLILQAEVEQLIAGVADVPGVLAVDNRLDVRPHADHIPALQGPGAKKIATLPASWQTWTPTMRLIAGIAGVGLLAASASKGTLRRTAAGAAGLELLERAVIGTPG